MAIGSWLWSSGLYPCHLVRHQNSYIEARYLGGHVRHLLCTIHLHEGGKNTSFW